MTTPNETPAPHGPDSLAGRLLETVRELTALSESLRTALVHRRVDEIWNLLAAKEEQVAKLEEYGRLWHEMDLAANPEHQAARARIRRQLALLQLHERSNGALAHSFLSSVRRALSSLGPEDVAGPASYTPQGRSNTRNTSRIIRLLG
jgi:hypothetical protein